MKKLHRLLLLAPALALAFPPPASAQNPPNRPPGKTEATERKGEKRRMGASAQRRDPRHVKSLLGQEVTNFQNQRIGEIEDVVVDLVSGQVVGVVITADGVLDDSDRFTVVRMNELQRIGTGDDIRFRIDADKARLLATPSYKRGEEPDYTSVTYVGYFYEPALPHTYPPESTRNDMRASDADTDRRHGDATAADNTARNRQDRAMEQPTPINQSNEQSDLDVSARIRRELVDRDHLSTNAKNVKIITARGTVTLRGPVQTAAEKREVEELARRMAAGRQVSSQLEVVQL